MSTVPRPSKRPRTPTEADPFFYGWRDVWQANGHGGKTLVQLPLTEEDILHPQEGDFVIQNTPHGLDCIYLFNVGQICLVDRPHDDILYDLLIHWDIPGLRAHGPDIAVVRGLRRRQLWRSFHVAREGVRPELIIEVTSPQTRATDLGRKRRQYWQAGVRFYVIVDELPRRRTRTLRLIGLERGPRGYRRLRPNDRGWLWLETLGVWLGQENGRAVCYDGQGNPIGTVAEIDQARRAAEESRAPAGRRTATAARR